MLSKTTMLRGGAAILLVGLAGCQNGGGGLLAAAGGAGAGSGRTNYTCPGGTYFDTLYDPSNTTMQLRVDGATSHPHTLNRVIQAGGATVFQDAEYRLIPGSGTEQVTLQELSPQQSTLVCSKIP